MSLVGNLEDLGLGEVLQIVSLSRKSGVLTLRSRNREGNIVFFHGRVVHATSNVFPEKFGHLLLRRNLIDVETLKQALRHQQELEDPPLVGEILVQDFGIPAQSLDVVAKEYIEQIIYSFFGWSEGSFAFKLKDPADLSHLNLNSAQQILQQGLNTQWLAIEGTRLVDEKRYRGEVSDESANWMVHAGLDLDPGPAAAHELAPEASGGVASYDLIRDLVEELGEATTGTLAARTGQGDALQLLNSMIQELGHPSEGGEVLLHVLRFATEFVNRAVIFQVREKEIVGLGQFGIEFDGDNAASGIRQIRIPTDEPSIFSQVLEWKTALHVNLSESVWDRRLQDELGGRRPVEIFLGPLIAEDRVVAILYGDNLPEMIPVAQTEALEIFLAHAGLLLEKSLLERKLRGHPSR